jgi:hypothetical protein
MSATVALTTRYVSEREFVFSPHVLGFPSISGCHAICYVSDAGLFGYHSLGGETATSWNARAAFFGTFESTHASGRATGRAIYAACYLTPGPAGGRGYSAPRRDNWIAELTAFAGAVGFNSGPIYGYDLGLLPGVGRSAYVEFTRTGSTCVVQARNWVDHEETTGAVTDHVNIRYLARDGGPITNRSTATIIGVGATALKTVYPEKLR